MRQQTKENIFHLEEKLQFPSKWKKSSFIMKCITIHEAEAEAEGL